MCKKFYAQYEEREKKERRKLGENDKEAGLTNWVIQSSCKTNIDDENLSLTMMSESMSSF